MSEPGVTAVAHGDLVRVAVGGTGLLDKAAREAFAQQFVAACLEADVSAAQMREEAGND